MLLKIKAVNARQIEKDWQSRQFVYAAVRYRQFKGWMSIRTYTSRCFAVLSWRALRNLDSARSSAG
jgi:hypothetical protein